MRGFHAWFSRLNEYLGVGIVYHALFCFAYIFWCGNRQVHVSWGTLLFLHSSQTVTVIGSHFALQITDLESPCHEKFY